MSASNAFVDVDFEVACFAHATGIHIPVDVRAVGRNLGSTSFVVAGFAEALRVVLLVGVGAVGYSPGYSALKSRPWRF